MHVHAPGMTAFVDLQKTIQQSQTEPRCPVCQGLGIVGQLDGPGSILGHFRVCKACNGTGKINYSV